MVWRKEQNRLSSVALGRTVQCQLMSLVESIQFVDWVNSTVNISVAHSLKNKANAAWTQRERSVDTEECRPTLLWVDAAWTQRKHRVSAGADIRQPLSEHEQNDDGRPDTDWTQTGRKPDTH